MEYYKEPKEGRLIDILLISAALGIAFGSITGTVKTRVDKGEYPSMIEGYEMYYQTEIKQPIKQYIVNDFYKMENVPWLGVHGL